MSVVVNASRIGKVGGLRTFAEALVRCLKDTSGVSVLVPSGIRLATDIEQQFVPSWLASSTRVSLLRPLLWWVYSAWFIPVEPTRKVLCSTHHVLPFHNHQVVTVHDIRPYFYPDSWIQGFNFRFLLPRALKKCDGVLTVSESSKELLVSTYGLEPQRVYVVPNIVDCEFFHSCASGFQGEAPYLLTVGGTWKHKNVSELLKMHEVWAATYTLKVVAGAGQYSKSLKDLVATLGIEDRVEFLSGVSATELRSLYQHCASLVYPSIMEGFGLPPLEAMSCGRPVIVSDIPVFRELYGDVPIYVRLGDLESWKDAFMTLAQSSAIRSRSGIEHARTFSQSRMREALLLAIRAIWGYGEESHTKRSP